MGETVTFPCSETDAEAGDTASSTYTVTCDNLGRFPNAAEWPECAVPANCPEAPTPNATLTTLTLADTAQQTGIKANRWGLVEEMGKCAVLLLYRNNIFSLVFSCPTKLKGF